ncbi:MAG: glycosyltransferase family 2 protein [Patescibacteria group bacterium]
MKISVVISTFNNEKQIETCLKSVAWADEIVVVDDGSTDKTLEIVKKYTSQIYHHKSVGYVEPTRNFAIKKAAGDWILIVDADEEVPESLAKKLRAIADTSSEITHVLLPRKNMIFGKWIQHTGWWPDHLIRFFKKGSVTWQDEIHSIPKTTGESMTLDGESNGLIHHHYQAITQFLHKNLEQYAPQEAKELLEKGYRFSAVDVIRFPTREFLSRYFAREGYKDGLHGLILSLLMAVYHFVIFLHLWEANKFTQVDEKTLSKNIKDEANSMKKEFIFWFNKQQVDKAATPLKKFLLKVKGKLQ